MLSNVAMTSCRTGGHGEPSTELDDLCVLVFCGRRLP